VNSAHPYRNPVVGWPSDIDSTDREEVLEYFRTFYAPNNCIIALVGDVKAADAIALVEKAFGPLAAKPLPRRRITEEVPLEGERRLRMRLEGSPRVTIAWPTVAEGHPDGPALDVAARVLSGTGGFGGGGFGRRGGGGGGGSGRLFKRLVAPAEGEGVAITASASHRSGRYPGQFQVSATPIPGSGLQEVEDALQAEVERLATDLAADEELEAVRNSLDAAWVRSLDSNSGIARSILEAEALAGDWTWWLERRERTKAVTAQDVKRVVETYVRPDARCVGWLESTGGGRRRGRPGVPSEAGSTGSDGGIR
jgi:predicted Zn-dependent peptidase